MSRLGITYEEVAEAAFSIQKSGERPTIDKVRMHLGGTGSNTTISKHLHTWQHQTIHPYLLSNKGNQGEKADAPDIVKAAVDRVWQEMKQQTEADIQAIKNQTQEQVEAAEDRAQLAELNLNKIRSELGEITSSYQAQAAEKELLVLDLKQLHEAHALLQERYHALEQRYTDLQGLTAQHLTDLAHTHKHEIARLEDQNKKQEERDQQLINEMRKQSEEVRHQHIVAVDQLKVESQKQIKLKNDIQRQLQEKLSSIVKLETNLKSIEKERDQTLARLAEQEAKWIAFNNKSLVADALLAKTVERPTFDSVMDKFNTHFIELANHKFAEFNELVKRVKIVEKQMENQDE